MIKSKKTLALPLIVVLVLMALSSLLVTISPSQNAGVKTFSETSDFSYKTITEIGNPVIAGPGGSYYDDGTLYYLDTGNTVGYNLKHSDFLFDFNIVYNQLAFPSWFSLTFRASGCDRTQSPNLTQKGYSFVFFPAGSVQVWKDGATIFSQNISPIATGTRYNYKIGAINEDGAVRLLLFIDNQLVIDAKDLESPYLTGEWFNICSDGAVSANLISTKNVVIPSYPTFTLSTLDEFPMRAGTPLAKVDHYNNITLESAGSTVGFNQHLQNFSFEVKINFSTFAFPSNFYISARVSGFDRANAPALARKGYSFRFSALGDVEIYKEGVSLGIVNKGSSFVQGQDYIIEIGLVDLDSSSTLVYASVDNQVVVSVTDSNSPIQEGGFININGDGTVACTMTSSYTRLTPLKSTYAEQTETSEVSTYFYNTISYQDMAYNDFTNRNLQSILLDDVSIYDLNNAYYALDGDSRINAIDVSYVDNVLKITINKNVYSSSTNDGAQLNFSTLTIKKPSQNSGFVCPSGFVLRQSYYFDF